MPPAPPPASPADLIAALAPTDRVVDLTAALCDLPSVSGEEGPLADAVERVLRARGHLEVLRDGNTVVARTRLGRAERVVVAGHLDTVPVAHNLPTRREDRPGPDGVDREVLWGRGTVDMKGGVAMILAAAVRLTAPTRDVTWVLYDQEEVDSDRNGLGRVVRIHPDWVTGDFAVLGEPTDGGIEGGCNGTLRAEVHVPGVAAHSARSWRGVNAVHAAAPVLAALAAYEAPAVEVDGLVYREGLNAVGIRGGVAGNVIPPECVVTVNHRFAPSRSVADSEAFVRAFFAGYEVTVTDAAPGARPGLDHPAAAGFVAAVSAVTGAAPVAKEGWTDVARFAGLGIPAVNFGPGDPALAHSADEHCPTVQIERCLEGLLDWLT